MITSQVSIGVGYGDMVPITVLGKMVAAGYAVANLVIMTLPISIIITKFAVEDQENIQEEEA